MVEGGGPGACAGTSRRLLTPPLLLLILVEVATKGVAELEITGEGRTGGPLGEFSPDI